MRKELADILSRNRPQLVENIDPENGILNDLIARNVFTRRQAKSIEVLPDPYKQVEAILDNLRRRPDEDFDTFCEILCKHGQDEVVELYLNINSSSSSKPETEPYGLYSSDEETQATTFEGGACFNPETRDLTSTSRIRIHKTTMEFYNAFKDLAYPMCNANRGKCIIFNVEHVKGLSRREGSDEDLRNLRELFRQLHFTTDTFTDPTAKDITDKILELSRDPGLEQDQCLVLFFLSHGRIVTTMTRHGVAAIEHIYGSDGETVTTESILVPLTNARCPAMRGKPKVAFFQACREYASGGFQETASDGVATDAVRGGKEFESKVYPESTGASASASVAQAAFSSSLEQLPISLKDFVIGYSTESGHPSFRNTHGGSWYVSAIVQVFSESVHNMDLCAMLRKVNGIIAEWKPVGSAVDNRLSQVASHIDSLTKPYLFFFPGITTGTS